MYKNARKQVQHLIKSKKTTFYENKLKENIGKPNELWKTLKSLGLSSKRSSTPKVCLKKDDILYFDDKTNSSIFKDFIVI